MSGRAWLTATTLIVAVTAANVAGAQTIAQRVDAVRDGSVQLTFPARPGVCGDGNGSTYTTFGEGPNDRHGMTCINGPILVMLGKSDGQVVSVRSCVACRASRFGTPTTDLGAVSPQEAGRYLIALARRVGGRGADDAVSAAALADADVSMELSQLIRDESAMLAPRKQALFWFGQNPTPTRELVALYDALRPFSLREHYTFVLSQRRDDAALVKLIDIAQHDPDTKVRKQAMFWLGQSHDPKAVQFFKDILRR